MDQPTRVCGGGGEGESGRGGDVHVEFPPSPPLPLSPSSHRPSVSSSLRVLPISIVVPVFEEAGSLDALVGEIRATAERHGLSVEVVFVDDGSRDASWAKIVELADAEPWIGGLRFRRNRGKAAALMAGLTEARGETVFTMDADLQDPPEEMPRFLDKMDEGFDLVSGWKKRRHDPWHKVYPSRVFNKLIGMLTGVRLHDHVCGYKCMRREVARQIRIHGELHRFIGVLAAARGFRVTEIATLHRPRTTGVGKYGVSRFMKGFLDLLTVWALTRYGRRPQHLIGSVAAFLALGTALLLLLSRWLPLSIPLFLWTGALTPLVVLLTIGLVAELHVSSRVVDDLYSIVERAGWCRADGEEARAASVRPAEPRREASASPR